MPDLIVKIFAWFVEETVGFLCNFFLLDRIFLVNFSKNSLTLKREIFGKEIHQMSWKSWADGGTVHSSSESRELACRGKKSVHNEFLPQENFWQKKKINVPNPGPFFRLEKKKIRNGQKILRQLLVGQRSTTTTAQSFQQQQTVVVGGAPAASPQSTPPHWNNRFGFKVWDYPSAATWTSTGTLWHGQNCHKNFQMWKADESVFAVIWKIKLKLKLN